MLGFRNFILFSITFFLSVVRRKNLFTFRQQQIMIEMAQIKKNFFPLFCEILAM